MAALAKPRRGAADRTLLRLLLPSSSFSTKAKRWSHSPKPQAPPPKEAPPRPPEMPWTEELANSVRLTGLLKMPVQLETTADGRPWAVSLLMQDKSDSSPQFWTPLMFEDNLAEVAACHLKMNDLIYVSGQLRGDPPSSDPDHNQANFQVMVQNFHFVRCPVLVKENDAPTEDSGTKYDMNVRVVQPEYESIWVDLTSNPGEWWDNRKKKLDGLVNPNFPDFKHKTTKQALWIDRAPKQVLKQLDKLEFDVAVAPQSKTYSQLGCLPGTTVHYNVAKFILNELWVKFMENPDEWWDKRASKASKKHPDFIHKVTGEALWISSSPSWVLRKLPPLKTQQNIDLK